MKLWTSGREHTMRNIYKKLLVVAVVVVPLIAGVILALREICHYGVYERFNPVVLGYRMDVVVYIHAPWWDNRLLGDWECRFKLVDAAERYLVRWSVYDRIVKVGEVGRNEFWASVRSGEYDIFGKQVGFYSFQWGALESECRFLSSESLVRKHSGMAEEAIRRINDVYEIINEYGSSFKYDREFLKRCLSVQGKWNYDYHYSSILIGYAQQVDSAEASTIAVPPSILSGSPR